MIMKLWGKQHGKGPAGEPDWGKDGAEKGVTTFMGG